MKFIKKALIILLAIPLVAIALYALIIISTIFIWQINAAAGSIYDYPTAKWVCEEYDAWVIPRADIGVSLSCVGQIVLDGETQDICLGFTNNRTIAFFALEEDENHDLSVGNSVLFTADGKCNSKQMTLNNFYSGTINVDDFPASMKFVRVELTDEERELYNIASEPDPEAGTGFDAQANSPFSTQRGEEPNQAA